MSNKRDGFSAGADLLRKLFSAEYGKAKTIATGLGFIGTAVFAMARLGMEAHGVVAALILAAVASVVVLALVASVIEFFQKRKRQTPEERFRRLLPDLETLFWGMKARSTDPLEADRLADELRFLGVQWQWYLHGESRAIALRELKQLIRLARQRDLEGARRQYGPTARAKSLDVPFEHLLTPRPPPGDRDLPDAPPA